MELENAAVKTDDAGRIRPVKPKNPSKRIDGAMATIMGQKVLSMQQPVRPPQFQMYLCRRPPMMGEPLARRGYQFARCGCRP